jgi:hypothetical protein
MRWINFTSLLRTGENHPSKPVTHELTVATSVSEWTIRHSLTLVATARTKPMFEGRRD